MFKESDFFKEVKLTHLILDMNIYLEMLTCVLRAQVNESMIKIVYWNVYISFNL